MRKTVIDRLCEQYNQARGLVYPSIGYLTFADYKGDGQPPRRRLYEIVNQGGGVTRSILNGRTYRHTAEYLRRELQKMGV
jgi:hypothetical protein